MTSLLVVWVTIPLSVEGSDTADFSDIDVPVEIVVDAEGNGTATRETGFSIEVTDAEVNALNGLSDADFVSEAVAGNIYFNVHTADFTGGEIRGQLGVVSDITDADGVRTIVLEGGLDASQEPDPTSDSEATGFATLTITVDADGNATYSSTLDITGLATSDLISLGAVSAIHLHNAPAGENGPVVQDFIVDAGNPTGPALPFSVTEPVIEVDTLQSIEEFILSDDNDVFTATGAGSQTVFGGAGDDIIAGGGGTDFLDGGAGNDTNSFQGIGFDVVASLLDGTAQYGPVEETFVNFENLLGSDNDDSLTGDNEDNVLTGAAGADTLIGLDGDDTLVVDLDDIVIDGGEGSDTLDLSNLADGVRVDLDTILGNNEINVLEGGAGDDSIHSFAGVDTIDGGEGIDTALFTAGPGVIVELDEDGSGQAFVNVDGEAGGESDFFFNFENVNGSASGNDILVGNQEDNNLFGNGGDDICDDILTGGLGDDIIRGGEGSDTATFADLAADITAVDNGDGTVTVTTLTEGVDTLTDIEILLDGNGDTITVQPAAQETTDLSSAPADGPVFTPLSLENVGEVLFMSEDLEIFFAEDTAFGFEENINFDEDGAAIFVADVFEVA